VAKTQHRAAAGQDLDLLAAVVLHTLVAEGHAGMTLQRVAIACERDPSDPAELSEVERALEVLLDDGLAKREGEGELLRPTRAAVRAQELSF
jgi:hypothetical protein